MYLNGVVIGNNQHMGWNPIAFNNNVFFLKKGDVISCSGKWHLCAEDYIFIPVK